MLATRGQAFILFDGRPEHFLVQDGHLVGIIDLQEARSGDAAMDLGVLAVTDPDLLENVLDGYRPDAAEQALFDRLVPFYIFLRRLAAVEWHRQHGDPALARRALRLLADNPFP